MASRTKELRDEYLQAFAAGGDVGEKDEKTLAAYLNGQLCQIPEKLEEILVQQESLELEAGVGKTAQVFSKKYKPVARKVKPVLGTSPEEFRIERCITGDPLADMLKLDSNPPDFKPTGRYTAKCKEIIDQVHGDGFLWTEEMKAVHHLMMLQNEAFAWDDSQRVVMPVIPHTLWVLKNIPIADQIDTRGGYLHAVATEVSDFEQELDRARSQEVELRKAVLSQQQTSRIDPVAVLFLSQPLLLTEGTEEEKEADFQA
ncbi:hypothetical protein C0989_009501 [Termitomyces sp. Mn162]|nr:hypothetical protein C0989_009501 [Termitomyces sp. Mn162]